LLTFEQTGQFRSILIGCQSNVLIRLGADAWIVQSFQMFRATSMYARPDCELPPHLAELGVVLWMTKDVQGWKTLIEEIK
jgi:hypothetical protein